MKILLISVIISLTFIFMAVHLIIELANTTWFWDIVLILAMTFISSISVIIWFTVQERKIIMKWRKQDENNNS